MVDDKGFGMDEVGDRPDEVDDRSDDRVDDKEFDTCDVVD